MVNERFYNESIILIGPSGAGKSTLAEKLSDFLEMPRKSIDSVVFEDRKRGIIDKFSNMEKYNAYMIKREIEKAESFDIPWIVDFGGGQTVYDNKEIFEFVKKQMKKFKNVILLLPSKDIDESLKILNKRSKGDIRDNRNFIISPCNKELATKVIYENKRIPNEIANEVLDFTNSRKENLDYSLLEKKLNIEALTILHLIKKDYYKVMSERKKKTLDGLTNALINNKKIVIVNRGTNKDKVIAHSGGTLKDGKVHFYPDLRMFRTNEELLKKCKSILPHELFHFFLLPHRFVAEEEKIKEMSGYYTEGLVERETRFFCLKHKEILYEKACYGYNINFVNSIEKSLGVNSYEMLFGEDNYLTNIGDFEKEYDAFVRYENETIKMIEDIAKEYPANLRVDFYKKVRKEALQDGVKKQYLDKYRNKNTDEMEI